MKKILLLFAIFVAFAAVTTELLPQSIYETFIHRNENLHINVEEIDSGLSKIATRTTAESIITKKINIGNSLNNSRNIYRLLFFQAELPDQSISVSEFFRRISTQRHNDKIVSSIIETRFISKILSAVSILIISFVYGSTKKDKAMILLKHFLMICLWIWIVIWPATVLSGSLYVGVITAFMPAIYLFKKRSSLLWPTIFVYVLASSIVLHSWNIDKELGKDSSKKRISALSKSLVVPSIKPIWNKTFHFAREGEYILKYSSFDEEYGKIYAIAISKNGLISKPVLINRDI